MVKSSPWMLRWSPDAQELCSVELHVSCVRPGLTQPGPPVSPFAEREPVPWTSVVSVSITSPPVPTYLSPWTPNRSAHRFSHGSLWNFEVCLTWLLPEPRLASPHSCYCTVIKMCEFMSFLYLSFFSLIFSLKSPTHKNVYGEWGMGSGENGCFKLPKLEIFLKKKIPVHWD